MRSASLTVEIVDVPSSVKGSWAKVVARRKNRGGTRDRKLGLYHVEH